MKIFNVNNQPFISEKYKYSIFEFSISEVKVPDYDEYLVTIYMFVNNINGKMYIGLTITKFYTRFQKHYQNTYTSPDNLPLHKALRKYGWDNFSKYIIWQDDICYKNTPENKTIAKNIANEKEVSYIELYDSYNCGYNCTLGGEYMPKNVYNEESIKKANKTRDANKSNYMLGRTYDKHHLAVKVRQYDLEKNFIKEWSCIKLAADTLNITIVPSAISSGNFFWIYSNDPNIEKTLENKYQIYNNSYHFKIERIYCYDLNKNLINVFESGASAAKYFQITASEIIHSANNGTVCHSMIFIKESNLNNIDEIFVNICKKSKTYITYMKPIYQIFLNGQIIKLWDNLHSIRQELGSTTSINKCLNHRLNVYSNCFWIYEDEYSDELLINLLESFKKTKKSLVDDALSGKLIYTGITKKLDTSENKIFLKENPGVYQLDKQHNIIKYWDNYKDIEKETDFKFANISKCLRHKMNSAYNYIWRFKHEIDE